MAGSGAVVVGRNSGAASFCPGMCDEGWSPNELPAANDKCLPFCCGDCDDDIGNAEKSLDGAVPTVLRWRDRSSIGIGMGEQEGKSNKSDAVRASLQRISALGMQICRG